MPSSPSKICIRCGQDCSAKPRTKDTQGRYTCKACADAAPKPKAAAAPVPAEPDPDAALMAALMAQAKPDITESCPSCGSGLAPGAVICTICGYNKQSGRSQKSIIGAGMPSAGKSGGSAALGVAASLGGAAAKKTGGMIFGAIGGVVGGAIGAAVWAAVAYSLNLEIGWIAWGIGFLVGVGVATLSGSQAGLLTGLMAAAIALASVAGGKYATVSMVVDNYAKSALKEQSNMTGEDAILVFAGQLAADAEQKGKKLNWPKGVLGLDDAETLDDFPPEIAADATARWDAMDPGVQDTILADLRAFAKADTEARIEEAKASIFKDTIGPFDALWAFLAVVTAFSIGRSNIATKQGG